MALANAVSHAGATQERKRVAALSLPLLLNRCTTVLRTYLADAAVRGRFPFTRYVIVFAIIENPGLIM